MAFQNCIQQAQNSFSIPYLVGNGTISSSSASPPSWVLVGGLLASSFISCIVSDYWWGNPLQPIASSNLVTIFDEDEAQIGSVVNPLYELYGKLSQLNDNFSFIQQALKFDVLEILYLNYNNYDAFIQSVKSYKQYIISQFQQTLQPFTQNFLLSANAYYQTFYNLYRLGRINISSNTDSNTNVTVQPNNFVVLYYPNTPIPAGFGVNVTVTGDWNGNNIYKTISFTMFFLFGNPSQSFNAVFYDQNNNIVNQMSVTFNNVVVIQSPLGLTILLPYIAFDEIDEIYNNTYQQIPGVYVSLVNTLGFSLDYNFSIQSPLSTIVPIIVNLNQKSPNNIYVTSPSNVVTYLSLQVLADYYQFLQNLDLESYADYLWNYYHNNGVTQEQLYNIINGMDFSVNVPKCNPITAVSEITTLFNIVNSLALQNQSTQVNVYPISVYGTFNIQGLGQTSGYIQFNQPVVLTPNQCTNVGGFITTQNDQLYVIPPGQSICNTSNFTVVFRPDIYTVNNNCYTVPIPYTLIPVQNQPLNSVGVVLNLNNNAVFEANQQYTLQGWYVNSSLDANDSIDQITFTPNQNFTYIPSQFAYLTLSSQGVQNLGQITQSEVLMPSQSSASSSTPSQPQSQQSSQPFINPILIIIGLLLAGIGLGLIMYYFKRK